MNELQRVGLVFKEDGSVDFVKSLKLVNATLKENYETFKLVQAQWDNSTSTTQKLKDKLVYLNEAYDIQQDKVTTLKMELQELESAENRDEVAIQKKKAALAQAETSLQKYKNQIDDTTIKLKTGSEAIKEYGDKVKNEGEKIEKAGKKISAFSAASLAALTASAKGAIDFESAFTGVEKTVDATDEQLEELKIQTRQMAKEIPATTTEISAVAEAAGQLGIKTEDIMSFTRVMIDLGNSTNLSASDAASSLAKFANVTKMSASNYSNLGSVIVALGNNFATTEADIVQMGTRLAATGELTGLSQSQIMALATAMSAVGIEAEAGGSAMSKLLKKIQVSVETGSKDLNKFAKVAGMSAKDFKKAFEQDSVKALSAFISGLNDTKRNGKSAIAVLDDMGLTEVRLSNTILSLANSSEVMNEAVDLANQAWEENNALSNEANKRYDTLKSQMTVTLNNVKDMGITLGNKLMPSIEKILNKVGEWINKFEQLDEGQVDLIVNLGLLIATLGPVVTIIGKVTSGVGSTITAFGKLKEGLGHIISKSKETEDSMNGMSSAIDFIKSPIGLACTAIGVAIAGVAIHANNAKKEVEKNFSGMASSANDFITGIENAKSHLSSFNSTLFASAEEQQQLKENMNEVQRGITIICKTASDERRGYTDEEIAQLDEYFTKLHDLKNRELQIQSEIAAAITQQAVTNAKNFQGSLDEYKVQSQEWIKTAEEQKNATISLIEQGTIEEIALLNQRYSTEEAKQSEAYQKEYNAIMEQKQIKIDAANDEVAKVTSVYADGYTKKVETETDYLNLVKDTNEKITAAKEEFMARLLFIEEAGYRDENAKIKDQLKIIEEYQRVESNIWREMTKCMSEEEAKQLGVWLANQANTEMYGGEISKETRSLVNTLIESYDSLPKKTREAMKNAMTPMLEEMQKKEPSLYAKASGIADGILGRLKKSFDIHSPSKKTRKIFQQVMQGSELGLEDEESALYNKAEDIADNIIDRFGNADNVNFGFDNTGRIGNANESNIEFIDYEKLYMIFLKALNTCKIQIDKDCFVHFIDNRLMEVM